MDSANIRKTAPVILPFSSIGEAERRLCAVFTLDDGSTLALQATCILGGSPVVTIFATRLAAGSETWSPATAVAIELPIPAPLSLKLAPILMRGTDDHAVAWAFESGGLLIVTPKAARVEEIPVLGRMLALGAGEEGLCAAVQRAGSESADICVKTADGWSEVGAGPLACGDGSVTSVAIFGGHVFAARSDSIMGFDLFRADLASNGDWEPVITNGGFRHAYNRAVSAMAVVGGRLIVAADGPDTTLVYVGDEHPEIFAVDADGQWVLFSGQGRFTPQGLRRPESAGGPGTPDFRGLTIGGLRARGKDMVLWLKPRGTANDLAVLCQWSAKSGDWTVQETMPAPALAMTSMALTAEGTCLIGCAAEGNPADISEDIFALSKSVPLLLVQTP